MEILSYVIYGILTTAIGWVIATILVDIPKISRDLEALNDTAWRIERLLREKKNDNNQT